MMQLRLFRNRSCVGILGNWDGVKTTGDGVSAPAKGRRIVSTVSRGNISRESMWK